MCFDFPPNTLHCRFGLSDLRVGLMRRGQIVARIDFHQQISGL